MINFKRCLLLLFVCFMFLLSHAQDKQWMAGTWKGRGNLKKSPFIRTIVINNVSGNNFTGTRTIEASDKNHNKIIQAISGMINKDTFYIKNGAVLSEDKRKNVQWIDCANCVPVNNIEITYDSIFLISEVIGCEQACEGTFIYYKLLPDLDTATQHDLVEMYGTPEQKIAFKPFIKTVPVIASTNVDGASQKRISDSLKNAEAVANRRKQQIEDSLKTAAAKRLKQISDSTTLANNIARQKQQQITDSLKLAAKLEKQRQQQIDDSISVAKAKRLKEIQDSTAIANALAKKRQQQITDSLKIADRLAKQRQQQIDDSISVAKAKRLKEIQDSTTIANNLAKQKQQHIDDSIVQIKIRQQQVADSFKIAESKKKIVDTATTVASKAAQDKSKLLVQRDNVLLQTYHITTPDILIELFDNAQIDGDRVSVYHNNTLIINNQMLTHESIIYKVHADANNRTHEFILVAENLGTIPPNTALMRITAGNEVYKLSVKTDLKTNAKIDFYYDGN